MFTQQSDKAMKNTKQKELVFGTFIDLEANKTTSLNGSEICFVLAVEDFNNFISKHTSKNYSDTAILMRYTAEESFVEEFLENLQEYKTPHNKHWYYKNPMNEAIESMSRMTKYKPRVYKSQKDPKFKHIEQGKFVKKGY